MDNNKHIFNSVIKKISGLFNATKNKPVDDIKNKYDIRLEQVENGYEPCYSNIKIEAKPEWCKHCIYNDHCTNKRHLTIGD